MKNFELEYKSALGTATTMYACAKESNDREMIQSLELIFPELKKSKDELIREEIRNCFVEMKKQGCFPSKHKEQYDSWIEWLEKQGEQNPVDEPKQEWNTEDENTFACLWGILNWVESSNYNSAKNIGEYIDWLQSLKQRLNGYE